MEFDIEGAIELEEGCPCGTQAHGWMPDPHCESCCGTGLRPTRFGERILELVRKHGRTS
jgi:hypothetical protein